MNHSTDSRDIHGTRQLAERATMVRVAVGQMTSTASKLKNFDVSVGNLKTYMMVPEA